MASAAAHQSGLPWDTLIISAISAALGVLALINASKAKQQQAATEGHAANIQAFDQAARFYRETHERQGEQVQQLVEENTRLAAQNATLTRQLNRFERLVAELKIVLPDEWQGNGG